MYGIAIAHSVFNILCTAMLLPAGNLLEKLAIRLVPDAQAPGGDVRSWTPACWPPCPGPGPGPGRYREMAQCVRPPWKTPWTPSLPIPPELARSIREEDEERCDHYEDIIGTYLVQLSSHSLSDSESQESTELLKTIGDFERISDHAVNVLESAEELQSKDCPSLRRPWRSIRPWPGPSGRSCTCPWTASVQNDAARAARGGAPGAGHRQAEGRKCAPATSCVCAAGSAASRPGFVWVDLLTDLERTSDHCSNVAGCVIDAGRHNPNLHETLRAAQIQDPDYAGRFRAYAQEYYCLPEGE